MARMHSTIYLLTSLLFIHCLASSQNYDETQVPEYALPDLMIDFQGDKVNSITEWEKARRPEILQVFTDSVYGMVPPVEFNKDISVRTGSFHVNGIRGIQDQVRMVLSHGSDSIVIHVLIILPEGYQIPVFLGLNNLGNSAIHANQEISLASGWMKNVPEYDIFNHRAGESNRGVQSSRWPVERILKRGYGLVTFHASEVFPDRPDHGEAPLRALMKTGASSEESSFGAIAGWAWGLSRVMDYLVSDERIDDSRVVLVGHSRRGKAALWAGAVDQRFAAVMANNSGCMGAALSRRRYGETVELIYNKFPHWFCEGFERYCGRENSMPVDQHMLLALMAPRPLYIASAAEDFWADPTGEYLAALHASEIYETYGLRGLTEKHPPPVNQPVVQSYVGYHIRSGEHDLTRYDWERFMDFTDRLVK